MAMSKNAMNEYMNGGEEDVCSRVKIEEEKFMNLIFSPDFNSQ